MQVKHIGIGKSPEKTNKIPSVLSAFSRVTPSLNEGCETLPVIKERGCQEAIAMVAKFQNPTGVKQNSEMVAQEEAGRSQPVQETEMNNIGISDGSIENRQQKRQRVLEQFLREVRRRDELTTAYESRIREDFRQKQEAEEQKLREEENRRQVLLDEALAREIQTEEEWKARTQATWEMEEMDKQKKLKQKEREKQLDKEFENMQRQLSEELQEQLEHSYQWKIEEIH